MEILHEPPTSSSFTPLSIHQSQTPDSFFSGPPILYHHSPSAILKFHAQDLASAPALSSLAEGAQRATNGVSVAVNGDDRDEEQDQELEVRGVDVWVTSERLILYSSTRSTGVSIPYPTISLHAIQSQPPSLFLQLLTSAQTFDDHDPDATISLTIVPSAASTPPNEAAPRPTTAGENADSIRAQTEQQSPTQALYAALSACANLHPDPLSGSDDDHENDQNPAVRFENGTNSDINGIYPLSNGHTDGTTALPPPMPGSGGWITAENVSDFFDEEGNWRGGEEWTESEVLGVPGGGLGEGAGSVRAREEGAEGDALGEEGDETKWRRTD